MNKRNFLSKFILAAAATMGLVACGGGGDSTDTSAPASVSLLPDGKVGTAGDLVNKAEFAAITCGMTKEQVMAIVVDQPTKVIGDFNAVNVALVWNNSNGIVALNFNGVLTVKGLSSATNSSTPVTVNC